MTRTLGAILTCDSQQLDFRFWPVRNGAFVVGPAAKLHSQIDPGQITSGVAVISYAASR
jgi:hypothetical protein